MRQTLERLTIAALSVTLTTSSAKADWQYTKWGMTVQELVSASPSESNLRNGSTNSNVLTVIGEYSAEKFAFKSRFEFSENSLVAVRLTLSDGSMKACSQLQDALEAIYGRSEEGFTMYGESLLPFPYKRWREEDAGNIITLIGIDDCDLLYKPIRPTRKKTKGL
ncbi:hypothetical protein HFO41_03535 [Rhizobium leguminosarum]|uniref:hypothetical protein n=1 Tax=Rhizobium leguminosarum TaxID=384 RepID=UPI001A93704C|nr:hypothetical protein [Rhizobium leguminosarum]MBY5558767.1 hypothetical protein [Rhizobium leguminosarum]MBY5633219.1 hypothetical protein [Rhizobium leguminosarum]MBY5687931.1 hypothetical protein [Rhizobium leguminosarum]MBY5726853.1 hypothetical protein [Rhizobium leguminosarum]MBY5742447.1 hypothetical protein [Rhizobium leguminosarum]